MLKQSVLLGIIFGLALTALILMWIPNGEAAPQQSDTHSISNVYVGYIKNVDIYKFIDNEDVCYLGINNSNSLAISCAYNNPKNLGEGKEE